MAQFIFEGRDKTQRTGHEKIAMRNMRHAFNWIVGGYYNCLQDGYLEDLPKDRESLADEIYFEAMTSLYGEGMCIQNKAPREMRFAGEKFCRAYINWKLDNDGDAKEILEVAKGGEELIPEDIRQALDMINTVPEAEWNTKRDPVHGAVVKREQTAFYDITYYEDGYEKEFYIGD